VKIDLPRQPKEYEAPPRRLVGATSESFYFCSTTGSDAPFRFVFERGGARDHWGEPSASEYVAEVGFDGVERARWEKTIAHWVFDGVAIFHHPGGNVPTLAQRLDSGEPIWAYNGDVYKLWRDRVLAWCPVKQRLELRSHASGEVELDLDVNVSEMRNVVKDDEIIVALEHRRIVVHSLRERAKVRDIELGDITPHPSYLAHLAIADGCLWFATHDTGGTDFALVAFDLTSGELVARYPGDVRRYGVLHGGRHASWGAIFEQDMRSTQPTRDALITRAARKPPHNGRVMHANGEHLVTVDGDSLATLFSSSGRASTCFFGFSPTRLHLTRTHVVAQWSDSRFGAVALADLQERVPGMRSPSPRWSSDEPWYSVGEVKLEQPTLDASETALLAALTAAGLIDIDPVGRRRVLDEALDDTEASEPEAPVKLLTHAGTTRVITFEEYNVDIVDAVNEALDDDVVRFSSSSEEGDDLTIRLVSSADSDHEDEDEDEDEDDPLTRIVYTETPPTEVIEAMNELLEEAGAKRRIYGFGDGRTCAVMLPAEATQLFAALPALAGATAPASK
jgi:hypothetical protein